MLERHISLVWLTITNTNQNTIISIQTLLLSWLPATSSDDRETFFTLFSGKINGPGANFIPVDHDSKQVTYPGRPSDLNPISTQDLLSIVSHMCPLLPLLIKSSASYFFPVISLPSANLSPQAAYLIIFNLTTDPFPASFYFLKKLLLTSFSSWLKVTISLISALPEVTNGILCVQIGEGEFSVLILFHLSAAFDNIDYAMLIDRLMNWAGISGTEIWFTSILDPIRSPLFMLPLGDLLNSYHRHADESLTSCLKLYNLNNLITLHGCRAFVTSRMSRNFPHFNSDKTKVLVIIHDCFRSLFQLIYIHYYHFYYYITIPDKKYNII